MDNLDVKDKGKNKNDEGRKNLENGSNSNKKRMRKQDSVERPEISSLEPVKDSAPKKSNSTSPSKEENSNKSSKTEESDNSTSNENSSDGKPKSHRKRSTSAPIKDPKNQLGAQVPESTTLVTPPIEINAQPTTFDTANLYQIEIFNSDQRRDPKQPAMGAIQEASEFYESHELQPLTKKAPPSSESPEKETQGTENPGNGENNSLREELPEKQPRFKWEGVDSAFSWVILFGSFVCNFIVDGIAFSQGIIQQEVKHTFNASTQTVALAGSLLVGVYLLVGPVVSVLYNYIGFRKVSMIGAIIAGVGFFIASFANSVTLFIISSGFISGAGFGFIYLPAIVIVGYWFEKRRALATGIAVCGSSIGGILFAFIFNYMMEEYGWRGLLLIWSGITLNCLWAGALFRPITLAKDTESSEESPSESQSQGGDTEGTEVRNSGKAQVETQNQDTPSAAKSKENQSESADDKAKLLEAKVDTSNNTGKLQTSSKPATQPIPTRRISVRLKSAAINQSSGSGKPKNVISSDGELHILHESVNEGKKGSHIQQQPVRVHMFQKHEQPRRADHTRRLLSENPGSHVEDEEMFRQRALTESGRRSRNTYAECDSKMDCQTQEPPIEIKKYTREVKHFTGSIAGMAQFMSSHDIRWLSSPGAAIRGSTEIYLPLGTVTKSREVLALVGSRRSSMGRREDLASSKASQAEEEEEGLDAESPDLIAKIGKEAKNILIKTFDPTLLTSPTYLLVLVSSFFSMMGFLIPFVYVVTFIKETRIDPPDFIVSLFDSVETASMNTRIQISVSVILMVINAGNAVGRIVSGYISDLPWLDCLWLNNIVLVVAGAANIAIPYMPQFYSMIILSLIFGVCIAAYVTLRSIILVEIIGVEKLTNAFGLLILFQGIAMMSGSPIAGYMFEATKSLTATFWFGGGLLAISGFTCFPLRWLKRLEARRKEKAEGSTSQPLPSPSTDAEQPGNGNVPHEAQAIPNGGNSSSPPRIKADSSSLEEVRVDNESTSRRGVGAKDKALA